MTSKLAKKVEIIRQTIRMSAKWHFARWFVVPVTGLSAIILFTYFNTPTIVWRLIGDGRVSSVLTNDELTNWRLTIFAILFVVCICVWWTLNRINHATTMNVSYFNFAAISVTSLIWLFTMFNTASGVLGAALFVIVLITAFIAIVVFSSKINATELLATLTDEERANIESAAKHF